MRQIRRGLLTLLILALASSPLLQSVEAQTYTIDLQSLTWDHATLRVLIIPQTTQPWWMNYYLNATLRAISVWNYALQNFSGYEPAYAPLSQVELVPTLGDRSVAGFDVYLTWREDLSGVGGGETIGVSQARFRPPYTMISNNITLASRIPQGTVLNERDSQNAAIHELGHALGLGHARTPNDVMDPRLTIGGPVIPVSTLDAYGVWQVMRWMGNPSGRQVSPGTSTILPADIQYKYLPLSYSSPVISIERQPWRIVVDLIQPYFAFILLITGALLIIATVARWRRDVEAHFPPSTPITSGPSYQTTWMSFQKGLFGGNRQLGLAAGYLRARISNILSNI